MDLKEKLKNFKAIHLIAIGIIFIFNLVFFAPQFEGKTVKAHDSISSTAWSKLPTDYSKQTGEPSYWNSSMFCGMPWGLLSKGYQYNFTRYLNKLSHAFFSYPAGYMIKAGLLTYLALILLGISPYLSVILALAFSFNVNYLVLIEAGHGNKLEVLAGFPLFISGLILAFRGKTIISFLVLSLSMSIAILRNHPQMVYYLLMLMFVFALVYFFFSIKNKKVSKFLKASVVAILAIGFGLGANLTQILSSKDVADGTMRGKPILKTEIKNEAANSSSNVNGLNWEYAMGWSFGKEDVFSTMIPRAVGGSSKEEIGKAVNGENSLANALKSDPRFKPKKDGNYTFPLYFGKMGSTGGPAYLGAAILFLFIFSMFLMEWKNKLAFGLTALFLIILSMGKNFEVVNHFLFDYLPFFNKFRAPSSIINILPAFLVLGIGIGLSKFFNSENKKQYLKPLIISGSITAGLCIIFYLIAMNMDSIDEGQELIKDARKSLLGADTIRSIAIIGAALLILFLYVKRNFKTTFLFIGLGAIILLDLVQVGKRYLDSESWVNKSTYQREFAPRPADQQIFALEKKGRAYYRVFDQSISTFNSAITSYHHNTIGGYHAAKLQRYQDLIDFQIGKGNMEVLNMLNTKYFISPQKQLQLNNQANGVAWFIKNIQEVNTPMEEIKALDSLKTKESAVVLSSEFEKSDYDGIGDGNGNIELISYKPLQLEYTVNTTTNQFAVFSEIWYGKNKSWRAYIDGKEANIVRVNYVLRGLEIPANAEYIRFVLDPPAKYASISTIFSLLLLILLVLAFFIPEKYKDKLNFVSE